MKLIKYHAQWCQPCHRLSKLISEVDLGTIQLEEVDVDKAENSVMVNAKVRGIPTLVLLDDQGVELRRISNVSSKQHLQDFLAGTI